MKDRHQIDWTPGVPRLVVSQRSDSEVDVRIQSATPNFKCYRARANGGRWRPLRGTQTRLRLNGKTNTLAIRSRNLFGVDGPVVTLVVVAR